MPITAPIPAAEYLRMSSDTQEVSLVYQSRAIADFAKKHGFTIVQSYQDPGRSGLTLNHRPGLARLLQDVVSPPQPFKAILVYDVSRWGRFQDTDKLRTTSSCAEAPGRRCITVLKPSRTLDRQQTRS